MILSELLTAIYGLMPHEGFAALMVQCDAFRRVTVISESNATQGQMLWSAVQQCALNSKREVIQNLNFPSGTSGQKTAQQYRAWGVI